MLFKRMAVYLSKNSEVKVKPSNGIYDDYIIELEDVEIRLPQEKLQEIYKKMEGVLNGNKAEEN